MKKRKIFYYLPYLMAFALLKPVLTFILYPHTRTVTVVDNLITRKGTSYEQTDPDDWTYSDETRTSDFDYHIENFLDYRNETFLYCFLLVSLAYLIANYKTLTKK
jgi:hypothetical protein